MSEERYRLCKLVLLAVFVAGSLFIGWQFSQNGRYVQFDRTSAQGGPTLVIDTRTGVVHGAGKE